jgi:hypothetical protein
MRVLRLLARKQLRRQIDWSASHQREFAMQILKTGARTLQFQAP